MRVLHDVLHNWTHLKHRRTYSRVVKNTLIKSTEKLRCTNLTHNSGHLALSQRTRFIQPRAHLSEIFCHFIQKISGQPCKGSVGFVVRGVIQWDQCDTVTRVIKMTISTFVTSVQWPLTVVTMLTGVTRLARVTLITRVTGWLLWLVSRVTRVNELTKVR